MDEEAATDYHNRHLIADVFGQWIAWWLSARRQAIEEERLAINHCALQQKGNFLYKLKCGVYLRNMKEFTTILGLTMEVLLLKRRGMRGFSTFLSKQLGRWNNLLRQEKWPTVQQHNSRRFLHRLKEKTRLRLKSSSSRRFRLNDGGSVKLKASAQKVMDKLLVLASVQTKQRELLQKSQIHWSTMLKRSSLRNWRQRCVAHMVEAQFERTYIDVHVKRKLLLKGSNGFKRLVCERKGRKQKDQICTEHAHRALIRRALRILYHATCAAHQTVATRHSNNKQIDNYHRHKAMRRVMVALLRRLKKRLLVSLPLLSKVTLHTIHMWGFRRKSHAVLRWMCQYQRKKLEQRRHKISSFHHHQRIALSALAQLKHSTVRTVEQKHHCYNGEYYRYSKCARLGLSNLMRHCVQQKHYAINNYRSVLFWKYYRTSIALHQFKLHQNRRQHKRKMLLDAQLDFENRTKREACVEFLRVACASGESDNNNNNVYNKGYTKDATILSRSECVLNAILVKRVFTAWKVCVGTSKCIKQKNYKPSVPHNLSTLSKPPTSNVNTSMLTSNAVHNSVPLSLLSRAPPRSQLPEALPLPVPIRDTKLDVRYVPHTSTTYQDTNNTSSPYAYLSTSTALSRPPYPTSAAFYQHQHNHNTMPSHNANTKFSEVSSRAAPRIGCDNAYSTLDSTIHLPNKHYPSYNAILVNQNAEDHYLAEQLSQFVQLVEATNLELCSPKQREWIREAALIFKAQLD